MTSIAELNLIRLFDFYLAAMFVVSTYRRLELYRAISGLVIGLPGRYPNLFGLLKRHRTIFLTWATLRPLILALLLSVVHTLATRLVWPHATLDAADLWHHWPSTLLVLPFGVAMLALDIYFLWNVGSLDRPDVEKQLDRAEYWLKGWKAPVVRVLSFGYVNPRQMVHEEVRKALIETSDMVNRSLWWTSVQVGLRIAFGLGLWTTWALGT